MVARSTHLEFELGASEAISLDQLAGWTLTSANVQAWLTEENDSRDYWLKPGEHHLIHSSGKVVLVSWPATGKGAALPAVIRLSPPAQEIAKKGFLPKFVSRHRALAWA